MTDHNATDLLRLMAREADLHRQASEEAFTACPSWRRRKKARLRARRTFWRLQAMHEERIWLERLPFEEVIAYVLEERGRP